MTNVEGYDISMEEAAQIVADLVPVAAKTKQQQALQLYIRSCERQAERRAIVAAARIAKQHQQHEIAAEIRAIPMPVEWHEEDAS